MVRLVGVGRKPKKPGERNWPTTVGCDGYMESPFRRSEEEKYYDMWIAFARPRMRTFFCRRIYSMKGSGGRKWSMSDWRWDEYMSEPRFIH